MDREKNGEGRKALKEEVVNCVEWKTSVEMTRVIEEHARTLTTHPEVPDVHRRVDADPLWQLPFGDEPEGLVNPHERPREMPR